MTPLHVTEPRTLNLARAPRPGTPHAGNLASLLYVAIGKQREQPRLPRLLVTPDVCREMLRHMPYVRDDTVLGVVVTDEGDDHPVLFGQQQRLFPGQRDRQLSAPIAGIDEVAFFVSLWGVHVHFE